MEEEEEEEEEDDDDDDDVYRILLVTFVFKSYHLPPTVCVLSVSCIRLKNIVSNSRNM